jgi:hypothetical protein
MRLIRPVALVAALAATPVFAQEWTEYVDRTERFSINFPGQPAIKEFTYPPQRGKPVPARSFTVQDGARRYSMTVVNLATLNQPSDVKGAIAWEAWNFRKRGGTITYDAFAQVDRIDGHQLHITNADGSVTFVGIYQHARRLYILEAIGPAASPGAMHFQQSLMILDEKGERIRYEQDAEGNRTTRIADLTDIC